MREQVNGDVEVIFTPWPYDAVARGVARLDELSPGWRKQMDPVSPLGMVRVCYATAMRRAGLRPWGADAHDCGFDAVGVGRERLLAQAWREAIAGGSK